MNKKRINLRTITYAPLCILLIVMTLICGMSFIISNNAKNAMIIAKEDYMDGIYTLDSLSKNIETLNNYSLSHIISTSLDSKVEINRQIEMLESNIDKDIENLKDDKFIGNNYKKLKDDYDDVKLNINQLMAFSANSDSNEAYVLANDKIAPKFSEMNEICEKSVKDIYAEADSAVKYTVSNVMKSKVILIVLICIAIVVAVCTFALLQFKLLKPLLKSTKTFSKMVSDINDGHGDLSTRIEINDNNELGDLANTINSFIETLQNILNVIIDKSKTLDIVVGSVNTSVKESGANVTDLSAVSEELSATMQEVETNTVKVKDNIESISNEANTIVTNANQLKDYTQTMSMSADDMEMDAKSSLESIDKNVTSILDVLNKSIKDSEKVQQINNLTNDILNIASQTNLLALNASIEAAHAGDAGKGFAVVATEIQQLADNSKKTASAIQETNGDVLIAVNNLVENANKLITFLQEDILPEFNKFVESSSDYKDKSNQIGNIANEFSLQASRLNDSIAEITYSISSITTSIEEGSNGVTTTAENIQDLATDMTNIEENMQRSNDVANALKTSVAVFVTN